MRKRLAAVFLVFCLTASLGPILSLAATITGVPAKIAVGETVPLTVTVSPSGASVRAWSVVSGNASIITMTQLNNDYYITGVSPGKATIRATVRETGKADAYLSFDIMCEGIPVQSISLNGPSGELSIGDRLYGTVSPSNATKQTIIWSIVPEPNAVAIHARFEDGNRLMADAPGTVTVKATVVNGGVMGANYEQLFYNIKVNVVPVSNISNVPVQASLNQELPLTGTVVPSNATYKTIKWEMYNQGGTDAIVNNNRLFSTIPGIVTVRAVIENGLGPGVPFMDTFEVNIRHIGVSEITGIPNRIAINRELTLNGVVHPADATYKTIVWNLGGTNTAGATLSGNTLLTRFEGVVEVIATVIDGVGVGVPYTQSFTLQSGFASVTSIANVPTRAVVGRILNLTGTVVPADATNQTITWSIDSTNITGVTLTGNSLLAPAPGEVTVRATVSNGYSPPGPGNVPPGTDYTQIFVIRVTAGALYETTVSVNNTAFGTASASPRESIPGETVFLNAKPQLGYYFEYWQVLSGNVVITDIYAPDTYFTMLESNVSVRAVFTQERVAASYNRYTVLVLDVSESMRGEPLERTKEAARHFCDAVLKVAGDNQIAVVTYAGTVRTECDFTADLATLRSAIDRIALGAGGTDMYGGLERADVLLSRYQTQSAISKNILLMADGMPTGRQSQNSGRYTISDHRYYQYCNAVYDLAWRIQRKNYYIYSLGFFHETMNTEDLRFAHNFMRDLQNRGFYDLNNPNDLRHYFGLIADAVVYGSGTSSGGGTGGSGSFTTGDRPSPWGEAEVGRAIAANLVPLELQSQYTTPLTRAEFCALAVKLYESVTGTTLPANPNRFIDTGDIYVQKMANLLYIDDAGNSRFAIEGDGITRSVNGISGLAFNPGGLLAREQAAHLMTNLASSVRKQSLPSYTASFNDINSAGAWARASIGKMCKAGIMTGTGNNNFSPKKIYTREEGIIAMLHLYQYL